MQMLRIKQVHTEVSLEEKHRG